MSDEDHDVDNMEDDEEEEEYNYKEKILELQREVESLKAKNKTLELKKKESDLGLNKIKTELNSLRSLDKLWKDAAKAVCLNIQNMKVLYDAQMDQIFEGWKNVVKTSERIQKRSTNLKEVQGVIRQLQQKIIQQDETIAGLNLRIRNLTTELEDKTKKVERLSEGIEEEVNRLCQPMRDKLAESMVSIMKEKALRAQERREIADLWPESFPMPSLLMKYRSLSAQEMSNRRQLSQKRDSFIALSLEIRANVAESQAWEIQYDDYGRPFYQHRKTGQVSEEAPDILQYKPPPGWDEHGNYIPPAENDAENWIMETDYKGQVFYKNKLTNEVSAGAPSVYDQVPAGKSREETVAEAAATVLDFIREKISKHCFIKRRQKEEVENPLTPEERRKKEKMLKNRTAEEVVASGDHITDEGELIELSKYQYDIETVEMLAFDLIPSSSRPDDEDIEEVRNSRRSFLSDHSVRDFKEDLFEGRSLIELDESELTVDNLRTMVEKFAETEEHLEKKLHRARALLQDFSFLLAEKSAAMDSRKISEMVDLRKTQERERKLAEKMLLVEKRQSSKSKTLDPEENPAIGTTDLSQPSPSKKDPKKTKKSRSKSAKATSEKLEADISPIIPVASLVAVEEIDDSGPVEAPFEIDMDEIETLVLGDPIRAFFGEISPSDESLRPDPQMVSTSKDLANFVFFCGFASLNPEDYPLQSSKSFSLATDLQYHSPVDDEWLTSHFFLTLSKSNFLQHQQDLGDRLSNLARFNGEHSAANGPSDESKDSAYLNGTARTPLARSVVETSAIEEQFKLWKAQVQFDDIIRFHLHRNAVVSHQNVGQKSLWSRSVSDVVHSVPYLRLCLSSISFISADLIDSVGSDPMIVRIALGRWVASSTSIFRSPSVMRWVDFKFEGDVDINDVQLMDMTVQIVIVPEGGSNATVIGEAVVNLSNILEGNLGRCFNFSVAMNRKDAFGTLRDSTEPLSSVMGHLSFDIVAAVRSRQEIRTDDWRESNVMRLLEPKRSISDGKALKSRRSTNHVDGPLFSTDRQKMRVMVAELRGDNWTMGRKLTAANGMDFEKSKFARLSSTNGDVLKKLPNFDSATSFLERKFRYHRSEIRTQLAEIDAKGIELLDYFKSRKDKLVKDLQDCRQKQKKLVEQAEDLKTEVVRVTKVVVDLRKPNQEPKEPTFEDFPPVPYVPSIPTTGSLDNRGKKKKVLSPADMKSILESIESGNLDGADAFPFPEASFPSQAQQVKLGKSIQFRNELLDSIRQQEQQSRDRAVDMYNADKERWLAAEKRRLFELERAKKDCRKVNLRYDSAVQKLERFELENEGIETDIKSIQDLTLLQETSIVRFKQARAKQTMEAVRQEKYLQALRKKLFTCLSARRTAIELPRSAKTLMEYEALQQKSENMLSALKLEIYDCKHALCREGVRFRYLLREEQELVKAELMRIKVSLEILNQRSSFDGILQKYKFDCTNLLGELEKLKLREADKDDAGTETFDDWGERYLPTKTWINPEINKVQRMIDLTTAKSKSTEGFSRSAAESQRVVIDCLSNQYGEVYFTARDSWTEQSDYERAQQLLADAVTFWKVVRDLMDSEREGYLKPIQHFTAEGELRKAQIHNAISVHEEESLRLRFSAMSILDEMRRQMDEHSLRSVQKIESLEQSIVDLSRECQQVREELVAQQLAFDEKTKVLWAFIHTLQTSIQQMSAKMEILVEERDKIVIQAKLMADNTRHQLRIERKHSSNLSFIIHSQRGTIRYLKDIIKKIKTDAQKFQSEQKYEKLQLRRDVWENVFTFTRLCTDVDALFEFFASRLANLAGARFNLNDALAKNNAAVVLAALCRNPRAVIRRYAARALGGMGWNGFTEMRVLLWDSMMYWKMLKSKVISEESKEFNDSLTAFAADGKFDAILRMKSEIEEFTPSGNLSLRSIIKQRRQWALRAARRVEGPNVSNQKLLNVRDNVLTSLLQICLQDGAVDWEISRNAALAVSIASFEVANHHEMMSSELCVSMILQMCHAPDAEVQTHAAITIANLCHKDTMAQDIFGERGAIPVLLSMLRNPVSDVLEASSAALANLTCYCDKNCQQVLEANGVKMMVTVMTSAYSENLLDFDQNDEVQANAAEMLANVSRFSTQDSVRHFDGHCIDALVVMCASNNKQLKRNVSLVLGNIAQSERCRHEIGMRGGVEALFLATEDSDMIVVANALWALTNLMWYPPNQERAGRFTAEVVSFMRSDSEPVRINACVLAGNLLYYNTTNRVRFLETESALEMVLDMVSAKAHVAIVEALLRVLLSLTYIDSIAMWIGVDGGYIPLFLSFLEPPFFSRGSMRYSLEILCNLCLHHANRQIIHDQGGIERIVPLHSDVDPHIRSLSVDIIGHLEDITPPEVLARIRNDVGLERMISLASSSDPLVKAVAAETIGEEVWSASQSKFANENVQDKALQLGGIDALLAMLVDENEEVAVVLPALWSLRNLLHRHFGAQQKFGVMRDGIVMVTQILRRCWLGIYGKQVEKILEAALACLINAVQGHDKNARRLVLSGLDAVLAITNKDPSPDEHLQRALSADGVQALAKSILVCLGPYNYIVCSNCSKRQDLHGTSCVSCGHRLLVEIDDGILQARRDRRIMQSTLLGREVRPLHSSTWKHPGVAKSTIPVVEEMKDVNLTSAVQKFGQQDGGGMMRSKTVPTLASQKPESVRRDML